ncbi:MAG: Sortase family protein, LPXTG-site transpeptidase [Microgenomates group bacterium GW2011_GWA1_48_10]|nr:MAG: Sortase family protein, LPXTG-site transpeptidase [Microgenomates group bacterium GW2011_GWA1_48_10]
MALYCYIKKPNQRSILSRLPRPSRHQSRLSRKTVGVIASLCFFAGLFLVGQVAYPILGWYLFVLPGYSEKIVSPLSSSFPLARSLITPQEVKAQETPNPTSTSDDSYKISTWFVGLPSKNVPKSNLKVYNLSIPKLKIDAATVEIGGEDLKKSLIAWPTSAPPGNYGNNIIFGHSELPQFASPRNYSGIFTHLMDLAEGDDILVDYDGVRYKYTVTDKKVVSPTDLSVLEQRFDSAYITLITCLPPGTVLMRGIVQGTLAQI